MQTKFIVWNSNPSFVVAVRFIAQNNQIHPTRGLEGSGLYELLVIAKPKAVAIFHLLSFLPLPAKAGITCRGKLKQESSSVCHFEALAEESRLFVVAKLALLM